MQDEAAAARIPDFIKRLSYVPPFALRLKLLALPRSDSDGMLVVVEVFPKSAAIWMVSAAAQWSGFLNMRAHLIRRIVLIPWYYRGGSAPK